MYLKLGTISLLLVCWAVLEVQSRPQLPNIPREFQNINFEQYLRNERAMKFQLKCIIYNGPCDTIGKFIKRNIPVYLKTQCKNCDEEQKKLAGKFVLFIQENYPTEWDDALRKYGKSNYTEEEIAQFEKELGVKILRDKNAPTRAPGAKPNIDGLISLTKEAISAAINTKVPIVLGRSDSSTTISLRGITPPPQFAHLTTKKAPATEALTPATSSASSSSEVPTSESTTKVTEVKLAMVETDVADIAAPTTTETAEGTTDSTATAEADTTDQIPTEKA